MHGDEILDKSIHKLIPKIRHEKTIPERWKLGLICPIHTKGDKTIYSNYRRISLFITTYKILSKLLLDRLKPYGAKDMGH